MEEEAVGRGDRALMRTLWVLAAFLGLTLRPAGRTAGRAGEGQLPEVGTRPRLYFQESE